MKPYILAVSDQGPVVYSYVALPHPIYAAARLGAQGGLGSLAMQTLNATAALTPQIDMGAAAKSGLITFRERDHDKKAWHGTSAYKDPVLRAAAQRINADNYPRSLKEFAEEIVNEKFANALPDERPAARTVERIIRNSDHDASRRSEYDLEVSDL
jgi:hypothetical protein